MANPSEDYDHYIVTTLTMDSLNMFPFYLDWEKKDDIDAHTEDLTEIRYMIPEALFGVLTGDSL